jgi:KaiC/GvpD/RAD55 family RecA-like ATPase
MKVMPVTRLMKKQYKTQPLTEAWARCLGEVAQAFIMIVWGSSGSGKSNLVSEFTTEIARNNTVLVVALEEGFSVTTQATASRHKVNEMPGQVRYANHETTYETLIDFLLKKRSPKVVIIDSLQYFNISYTEYRKLKERFPRKTFIFISHAKGKSPDGKTAEKIRYDAGIKIRVEGFIAFVVSRYGGNNNYVIWEEGAKKYWGLKLYKKHLNR